MMFLITGTAVSFNKPDPTKTSPPTYQEAMAAQAPQQSNLPTRTSTRTSTGGGAYDSDDEAVPTNNPTNTTELLSERLQAWKHMCGYLENYISEVAKDQKSQAKDQDKVLKTLSHPLKEGHHFDQSAGGIAGLFENLRANTQSLSNLHTETSKSLTGSVLPILERLHSEIKNKQKELSHGAGKGSKAVEAARNSSQKHIEMLGQYTATFDSAGGKPAAANDPYVVQKQVYHRLNKQLLEENSTRQDLIAVQNSFQQFEAHVLQTVQTAMNAYNQHMSGQADRQKALYGDTAANAARIPGDFEWQGFVKRNGHVLISPNAPSRSLDQVNFPNQNHRSTKALIEGSLERKGKGLSALSGYSSNYYAVTPAGYLHEFKDNDNFRHDPAPETSLYLPDCIVGALDGVKFAIKGKDTSGGKLSQKIASTSEYTFKAHTPQDAAEWHRVIASVTSGTSNSMPNSPVDQKQQLPPMDSTAGVAGPGTGHPTSVEPMHQQTSAGVVQQPASATGTAPAGTGVSEHPSLYPSSNTTATGPTTH